MDVLYKFTFYLHTYLLMVCLCQMLKFHFSGQQR